ncbi:DoxX family membrane protein [Sneathiella sp. P13V-1]|uniref:DoxX family protein n=1 Tax=Sneathiella sp. P13V-1 TaxID=2697366 RepID=UPI00187B9EF1|nr:DoxX family protein [Sneathiella sp. P13V-1]MBE7638405.1 DoxX family membrane protein [Sneathiella sp. P13V-1]
MEKLNDFIELGGRVLLAALFIPAGFSKISGYEGIQGYMEAMGVPGALLPLVIILEIGGGIALLVGLKTKWIAFALAGFTLIAAVIFHYQPADQIQMILFMKNIAIAGGLALLIAIGGGKFSADGFLNKAKA